MTPKPAITIPAAHDLASAVTKAIDALRRGELVGLPTETVYGLAADASSPEAVARIFASKGRPDFNPLISHVASIDMAQQEGQLDERALALAKAFWPGPLTLVVPVGDDARSCELARAGLETIGLRMPAHPVAQSILEAFGGPLSAPSANRSGSLSPTTAGDVVGDLGDVVALVVDGGPCEAGIESSIVSVVPGDSPRLLRPGAISRTSLEGVIGKLAGRVSNDIDAPGQLTSHYAPKARLRLDANERQDDEALLGFGPSAPADAANLSRSGDTTEAAANLYRMLRELDSTGVRAIAVMPIPGEGLGEAINDRLRRAAAPRPPEGAESS